MLITMVRAVGLPQYHPPPNASASTERIRPIIVQVERRRSKVRSHGEDRPLAVTDVERYAAERCLLAEKNNGGLPAEGFCSSWSGLVAKQLPRCQPPHS